MAVYMENEALGQAKALYYAAESPNRDQRQRNRTGELVREAEAFAEVRLDIDPLLAKRLGIDMSRRLRIEEFANLLSGLRTDGLSIAGKQVQSESKPLSEILGLATDRLPTTEEVERIFNGRRANDGHKPIDPKYAETASKRFLEALGVPKTAKPNEIELLDSDIEPERPLIGALGYLVGNNEIDYTEANDLIARAYLNRTGDITSDIEDKIGQALTDVAMQTEPSEDKQRFKVNLEDYSRRITETKAPIAFVDLSFHPDKSVSVAYALAETPAQRGIYRQAVEAAGADVMRYVASELGFVKRGKAGSGGNEPGSLAWIGVMHDTSRPVLETVEQDEQGREYTDYHPVARVADPQLHPHKLLLNAVLTESGHIGSFDLDNMNGRTKQYGALFHVFLAQRLREHGCAVRLDKETGAAVLVDVSRDLCREFSKRHTDAQKAAEEAAQQEGLDWNALPKKRQIALLRGQMERRRQRKESTEGIFENWRAQADHVQPHRPNPLGRRRDIPTLSQERRIEIAVQIAEQLVAEQFTRDSVIPESELRELLIRGFVETGIGNAERDIEKAIDKVRTDGIRIDGEKTKLIFGWGEQVRGKTFRSVTTALAAEQERETLTLARKLSADNSSGLERDRIDRHREESAKTLPTGNYSDEQRKVIDLFATGSRLEVAIGVAGVGKTTLLKPLVSAWQEVGKDIHGVALNWSHATALTATGIQYDHCRALDKFLHDAKADRVKLGHNSIVVVDEIARVGVRQFRELLKIQDRTGCKVVALGDSRQCSGTEAGNIIDLVGKALPHAIPKMLYSARHKTERERQITAMFRKGEEIGRALAMKQEDKTVLLVAGGVKPTVEKVANLWAERVSAHRENPDFTITISAPTNAEARLIGEAIRRKRQETGEVGQDGFHIRAIDKNTKETFDLFLSEGDRIRLFDRVFDARLKGPRQSLGNNGDVVEIREIIPDRGIVIRNDAGAEGLIEWGKLRATKKEPVRLTLGYAVTIDAIQSVTSDEHISAYVSGTASATLRKHYTALSRQRDCNWLVVSESAEQQQIAKRRMWTEAPPIIRETDIYQNMAQNMARWTEKSSALAFLEKATSKIQNGRVLQGLDHIQQSKPETVQQASIIRRAMQQAQQFVQVEKFVQREVQARKQSLAQKP